MRVASGSGSAADGGADVNEVVVVAETERSEFDDVRLKDRQACAIRLTAVRWGAACESSSGSGLTVDLKRMRSHQLGTRRLLLESYTPLSSSVSAVPSPVMDRLDRPRPLMMGATDARRPSEIFSRDGAARWARSGVVGMLRGLLPSLRSWGVWELARRERMMRGGDGALTSSAHLDFARCAADTEIRLTSPPLV